MTTLTTIGNEFRLNTLTSPMVDVAQNPVVVTELAGGGFVAIWQVADTLLFSQDGGGASIFGQVFDNAGNPVGSMFQVDGATPTPGSIGTAGNQTLPSVTSLADGGFVVVWQSAHVAARGIDIYGQRYDATGTRVGTVQFAVNDQTTDPIDIQNASVNTVPGGGFLATWSQTSAAGNFEVFGRYFDASGTATTGNFQINTTTLLNQIQPSAAVFSDGTAIVVWQSDQDAAGGGFGIYGQRVNADGTLNGAQLQISTTTAGAQYGPSVVALDTDNDGALDDGFVVVWTSDNQDGSGSGIFGQKYNASFAKVGGEFLINQTTVNSQASPSIVHLSSGEIVVTWQSLTADGTTDVFARRFDASSTSVAPTAVTGEVLVNQTTPGQQTTGVNIIGTTTPRALDHNVVQLSNGDLAIVWSDAATSDVFGRLLSVNVATTDAPVVTAFAKNPVFGTEFGVNRAPVDLFHTVNVTTEGGDNIDVLTLTVRNVVNGAAEKLRVDGTLVDLVAGNTGPTTNGFTVNVAVSGTTATVTINAGPGGATAAQMTTLIDGLAYDNESTTPGPIRRVVTLTSISDTNDSGTPGNDTRTLVATSSTVSPPRVNELASVSTDYVQQTQPPANSGALVNVASDLLTPGGSALSDAARYISSDGRYVVFASTAANLVPGDTNGPFTVDVFVRDMLTGTTERVSLTDSELEFAGGTGTMMSISADGNRVLFLATDLFVRDRTLGGGSTIDVTFSVEGNPVTAFTPVAEISGDGTKVAFSATAFQTDFVAGDANNAADIFLRNLTANTTVRVSLTDNELAPNGGSAFPSISADGQYVAFVSAATNMVTAGAEGGLDTNGFLDIFRRDVVNGTTIRVSLTENDLQSTANPGGGGNSFQPAISADGNLVVFNSLAQLTAGDTDNLQDIYLRNISAGTTTLISNSPLLLAGTSNVAPSISPDGRYVAYGSTSDSMVFIFDTQTGLTSRAAVFTHGAQGNASAGVPSALANGYIAFSSGFNHLVPTDVNGGSVQDIFTNSIDSLMLGGTIWNDSTGVIPANITGDGVKQASENGIAGVLVSLFADLNNDDIPDTDTAIRFTFTSGTGDYQFNGLAPGNYIVRIDQDNFDAGGVSVALVSFPISPITIPEPPDADTDTDDNDDNGALVAGQGALSKAITLDYNTEPTTEDGNASTNFTLDFGFMANPPPVIANLGGDTVAFTEDGAPVLLDQGGNATVTDTNNTNFNGGNLTATVTGGTLEDVLSILSDTTILVSGTTVSFDPTGLGTGFVPIGTVAGLGTSSLTVTFNTNDATPAAATALIRHLNYDNTNSIEPPASRTVAVTVNDGFGAGGTSTVSNVTVNITQVNDEPTLTATGLTPIFPEGNAGVDLYNTVTANTIESGQTFASLTLTVTSVTDGAAEILRINDVDVALTNGNNVGLGGTAGSAGVSLLGTTATVTVTGATLTAAQLQTLIDTLLTYRNTSQDPTDADRVITITQVVDSGLGTGPDDNTATLNIAATVNVDPVNDEPTLTATGNSPTFTEDGGPADLYSAVTASTIEAGQTFTSMTLTVTNVTDVASEILFFDGSDVALTAGTIVTTATNGLLVSVSVIGTTATVTFGGAALTAAQLQTLVDGITYRNTSQNPTDANRVVTITELIDSGAGGGSNDNTATPNVASTVNVDPTNDAPTLDLDASAAGTGFSVQAVPGGAAVPVTDTDVNIVDPDNTTFASATFTVVNVQAGDLLAVSGVLPSNIVSSGFNAGTGVLTLTSAGAIATEAQWEQALHQVQFSATSATPGTRDVNITVDDGTASSNTAVATMVLNQPPTTPVDDDADPNAVTEGAVAGTEVQIDVSSADTDVPPTAVTFSFAPAGDAGGRFAIDPTSGVVTVSALGATTIDRESSGGTYTITVRATDGGGGISDANFDITVNDVAPAQPVDGVPPDGGSVQEGAGNGTAIGIDANSTDVNGGTVTFAITAGNVGNAFAIDANGVITVNDATQINFETLTSYLLTVQASTVGGTLTSTTQNFTIDVTNAAPVFNADNDGGADTVSEGAANGATVGITANFVDPNGGTVTYSLFDDAGGRFAINASTGVVTVADATLLNFESNTSHNITVRGSDPSGAFNDQGFSIAVTNVAPVATGDGYAVAEDGTLSVAAATGVLGNDSDVHGGGITAVLDAGPANAASFALQADGSFSYTPSGDFNGPDSFTYHAFDGTAAGNTVTVNLTVNEVNDTPTANDDPLASIAEDSGTRTILFTDLTGNDGKGPANEAGQTLTVTAVNNAIGGSVAIVAGHVEFTPAANFNGAASFDYTTTDNGTTNGVGDPKSDVGHVTFTVTSINDAPVLGGVPASRVLPADGAAITIAPALTVGDVDSSSLTSATVRVSAGSFAGANDVLAADTTGTSITAFYDPATEILTLSGPDTLDHYQQVLASVTFDTTDTNPGNSGLNPTRTIEWQLNDGSGANNLSSITTTTINVSQQSLSDFNGDSVSDVLWRNNNGFVAEWLMSDGAIGQNLGVAMPDPVWHFQDTGDFGADGKSDVLWRHDNGQVVLWQMDGATILSNQSVATIGNDWHNEGAADFNGDGKADVLWHNDSGQVALWTMDGAQITNNQLVGNLDAGWHFQGLLDTGGDGKSDVLLRNDSGQVVLWTMDGAQITANQSVANLGLDWNIAGTGDFGGDGKGDVLLRNDSGQVVIWTMDGNQIVDNQSVATPGNEWQVQDVGDYNLDGKSDVLWRHHDGQVVLWEMDGNQIVSNHTVTNQGGAPAPIGLDWAVQNHQYDVL